MTMAMRSCWAMVAFWTSAAVVAWGAAVTTTQSGYFRLDLRKGMRLAVTGAEEISVSGRWEGHAATATADGVVIATAEAGEEKTVEWLPENSGLHVLQHASGENVLEASFTMLAGDVAVHAGSIAGSEVWEEGTVHVVDGTVVVGNGVALTIERGAVVKFSSGSALVVASGGTCMAEGVVFTHIHDDTAGGDTMGDGDASLPEVDAYSVNGSLITDAATELRWMTDKTSGTLTGNTVWMGNRVICVTGDVAVANGGTLTVMPGAVVKFAAGKSLTVNGGGTLNAIGTRAQPIVFTSVKDDEYGGDTNGDGDATTAQPGDWGRIYAGGTVNMDYCRIRHCNNNGDHGAIHGTGGTVRFDDGVIEYSAYECVRMNSNGTFRSSNSVFRESSMAFGYRGGSGTYVYNGVVADCTVGCRAKNKHFYNTVFYRCQEFTDQNGDASEFDHCVFYNLEGRGAQSCAKVGQHGNIWGNPLFLDADGGDFRVAEGSPCVDAAASVVAPETDYYGQPRASVFGEALADIGIYEVQPRGVAGDVDLVPVSVSADAGASPGGELRVSWVVGNRGGKVAGGARRDAVSLASAGGREVSLGEKVFTQSVAAGGTVKCEAVFRVPPMAEGTWWPKVVVNSQQDIFEGSLIANNAKTGETGVEVSLPATAAASGASGTVAAGVPTVLKLHFEAGDGNRMVVLNVPQGVSVAWGFGFVPAAGGAGGTSGTSGMGGTAGASGTAVAEGAPVQFVAPDGVEDVYVVLESGEAVAYEVSTESGKLAVTSVEPGEVPSSGEATLAVSGAGFMLGAAVKLNGSGATVAAESVRVVDSRTISAMVDCGKLAAGEVYDVVVESGGENVTAKGAVRVAEAPGKARLEAWLEVPEAARQGRVGTGRIVYANVGNADMPCPIFRLSSLKGGVLFATAGGKKELSGELYLVGLGGRMPRGVLRAGEKTQVPFLYRVDSDYQITLSVVDTESEWSRRSVFKTWAEVQRAVSEAATRLNAGPVAVYDYETIYENAVRAGYGKNAEVVSGRLLDANSGLGMEGVALVLCETNGLPVAECTTDGQGGFLFVDLERQEAWTLATEACQLECGVLLAAEAANEVFGAPFGRVSCRLAFEDGVPADSSEVIVRVANGFGTVVDAVEGDAGLYSAEGLADGVWTWSVETEGFVCATNAPVSTLEAGLCGDGLVELGLVRSGHAVVTVSGAEGEALTGATVRLVDAEGTRHEAVSGLDGKVHFNVPPGTYGITAGGGWAVDEEHAVKVTAGETTESSVVLLEVPFGAFPCVGVAPMTALLSVVPDPRFADGCTYEWDFDGDGRTDSTEASPTNTYENAGTYAVGLVVRNRDGTEYSFRNPRAVEVWEPVESEYEDGTIVLDEASGYDVVSVDEGNVTLRTTGTAIAAALYDGLVLVFPDTGQARRVVSLAVQNDGTIRIATETTALASACRTLRTVEIARVGQMFQDGTESMCQFDETPIPFSGTVLGCIDLESELWLVTAIDKMDGKINKYYQGLQGTLMATINVDAVLQTEESWTFGKRFARKFGERKMEAVLLNKNIPVAAIPVNVRIKGFIKTEAAAGFGVSLPFKFRVSIGESYHEVGKRGVLVPEGSCPLINHPFDNMSWNLNGKLEAWAGIDLTAGVGGSVDVFGKEWAVRCLEVSATTGPAVTLEVRKQTDNAPDTYRLSAGLKTEFEFAPLNMMLGDFFTFKPYAKPFGPYWWNWLGGEVITPMPLMEVSQHDNADGSVSVAMRSTTTNSDWIIGIPSWHTDDGTVYTEQECPTHVFPAVEPGDEVWHEIVMYEGYRLNKKLLPAIPAVKTARKKILVHAAQQDPVPLESVDKKNGNVPQSVDPNEMAGPLGAGAARLVAPGKWMTYTVYFENKATATAAAQEVTVTEQLGGALDWSTFEVVDVGFNNQIDLGLGGKRRGASEAAMTGTAYKVRTTLDFDEKTGTANWYMRIVDESTETRWPRDVYAGFLPPNDATGRGEGHITYRVKLRDDAAAGTEVRASANIVFDYNAAIETDPAWWNTVAEMGTATVDLGNGVATNVTVMVGAPWVGQLPDPGKRPGMRFAGWFTGPNGTGSAVTEESVAAAGAKLYAFWDATAAPELWLDVSWGAVEIGTNGVVKGYAPDGSSVEGSANRYVLTGTSQVNGVKFVGGSFTNTWTNLVIDLDAKDAVAVTLEGASVEVTLAGDNSVASGEDCAGVRVDAASALVLQGEGRLVAQGGKCGAGIGGGKLQESGRVEIRSGTVEATGGEFGAGIGGGLVAPAAREVVIAGGSVKARGSDGGEDIGGGFGREGTGAPVGTAGTPVHEVEVPLATDALPAEVVVDLGGGETYRYAGPGHVGDTSLWFWLPDGTYEFAADGDDYGAHVAGTNAAAVFTDPGNANFVAPPVGEVSSEGSAMRAAMDPAYRTSPFEVWTATGLKGHAWDWTPVPPGGYDWDATNAVIRIPDGTNRTRVLRLKFLKR